MRIPHHLGVIPDGNRRWAEQNGFSREQGYDKGLDPGLQLFKLCRKAGVKELTYYGFTQDNTKRPSVQSRAFIRACINAVKMLSQEDAELLVIGNTASPMFPQELFPYTTRKTFGRGGLKINFLVNYGWQWDLGGTIRQISKEKNIWKSINSAQISRVDLIIRWGGRRRLSGFLPVQSIYADFFVVEDLWPDFKPAHFYEALEWYAQQDISLGG